MNRAPRSKRRAPWAPRSRFVVLVAACLVALVLAVVALAGCGGTETGVVVVTMEGLKFSPSSITIAPGTTVRWVNKDNTAHTSTAQGWKMNADNPPELWNSLPMNPGEEFERTFDTVGQFNYFCMVHPYMTGVVTVQEEGGPEPTQLPTNTTMGMTTTTGGMTTTTQAESTTTTGEAHTETTGAGETTTTTAAATATTGG